MYVVLNASGSQISGLMSLFTAKHTMAEMARGKHNR